MDPSQDLPPGYRRAWEADVVLSDGSIALVRPIIPSDTDGLHRFHAGQSAESVYLRFFAPLPRLSDKDVHRFTHVDYDSRVALVVLIHDEIAGIGRFDRLGQGEEHTAEVAFNVADAHRGRGIGSVLLEHLADIGSQIGVRRFLAEVLPQNRRMLGVFRDAGYEVSHEFDDGLIAVSFDIEPTDRSRAVRMSREHRAEGRSVRRVLTPSSVAVVGVSADPRSMGTRTLKHIVDGGFTGSIHAIGRNAAARGEPVCGHPVLGALTDVAEPIDLVVIAVPAENIVPLIDQCSQAQAKAVLIVSAGFAEDGTPQGQERQAAVLAATREQGMRLLGPNSFGFINAGESISLNASLSPRMPPLGRLGLFTQSGALGIALLASTERRNLGISTFVSAGNRSDISGNDLMQFWLDDDATTAVGLYLESMGNPRKFTRIARKLATVKPVIVVKSGVVSRQLTPGHSVRQTQERPGAFAAMLRQSGVIRVENTHQLFDVAQLVVHQPLPAGPRVAIVTNAPALGSLAADACASWRLDVVEESVAGTAFDEPAHFGAAVGAALDRPDVDSVVACFVPPLADADEQIAREVAAAVAARAKPCVATFLAVRGAPRGLPCYPMPEDAVRALAAATRYALWRARDRGVRVAPDGLNRRTAHDVVESFLARHPDGGVLDQDQAQSLLTAYGIDLWPICPVASAKEAKRAAAAVEGPVVLKAIHEDLRHEPGRRWVRMNLASGSATASAFEELTDTLAQMPGGRPPDLAVQALAPNGTAVEISTAEDPLFGPVVSFGVAGVPTELLSDVAHRFPPLRAGDIEDMVSGIGAAPLLQGYRGAEPVDLPALHDLIARVSVLADDHPEVALMNLNPVIAHADGVAVLGARVQVARAQQRTDTGRRSLNR
ncbi:MAG: GNAT family N-acetyltransferase [Ornithinimicrobium sp.]